MKPTIFGVPSGGLQAKTLSLLTKTWIIRNPDQGRKYQISTNYPGLILRILDRRNMPNCVLEGMADFWLTGMDYLIESGWDKDMEILWELNFSRATDGPTRFVLAGPKDAFKSIDDVRGKPIYTELPRLTELKLREKGFSDSDIDIRRTEGKTETWGVFNQNVIAEITESGKTLRENDMSILTELFQSLPTFFAPVWKVTSLMKDVIYLITRTLEQEQNPKVMAEMNVPRSVLNQVIACIPSAKSPTVMDTADMDIVVLKALMPRVDLIVRVGTLRRLGVSSIAEAEVTSVF